MSQTAGKKAVKGRGMSRKKRRALRSRRIAGCVVALLAVALGVFVATIGWSLGSILMAAAALLMLLLAMGLWMRRPMPRGAIILLGLVCVALAAVGCVDHYYALVGGRFVPRYALVRTLRVEDAYPSHFTGMSGLETLDMSNSTVTDFEPIAALNGLKELDLRGNDAFGDAQYQALAAALPDCHIRWSVPVGDAHFDSEQTEVDLTGLPLSVSQLQALFARWPDKHFTYLVPLMGSRYAPDTQALDLQGQPIDTAAIGEALSLLPNVNQIDLRGTPASAETVASVTAAWPNIRVMLTCDVPGVALTTEDTVATVTESYEQILACLPFMDCLPNLQRVDASAVDLTKEQIDSLRQSGYADRLSYSISLFGKHVPSDVTELNLDNTKINSVEQVEQLLAALPNLRRLSLCDCGLSQADMGQLFDAHPDVKFVWWIEIGGRYKLRTDATAFTTDLWDGNEFNYNSHTFAPLRYCTDLEMLDLGHNNISNIDGLRGLKKLKVLILADNRISDISALAELDDLEFVELFLNKISDLTPLADKTKLVDLNLFYNPIGNNYEVLKSMTWLKRLWIGGCKLSGDQLNDLKRSLPDTKVNWEGRGSTGNGWREHPHYETLLRMYETGMYIPFDDSPSAD